MQCTLAKPDEYPARPKPHGFAQHCRFDSMLGQHHGTPCVSWLLRQLVSHTSPHVCCCCRSLCLQHGKACQRPAEILGPLQVEACELSLVALLEKPVLLLSRHQLVLQDNAQGGIWQLSTKQSLSEGVQRTTRTGGVHGAVKCCLSTCMADSWPMQDVSGQRGCSTTHF